jgi:hypothetical protein
MAPFVHRNCCVFNAFTSAGNSAGDVVEVLKSPAPELGPVAEIEVLRERVRLPIARVDDGGLSPDTPRSVEIDEIACLVPYRLFHHKMTVQRHRLCPCEQGVVAVQVLPPRLDDGDAFVLIEIGERLSQKAAVGNEIGVEDRNELAGRRFQTMLQRTRFESRAVGAMDVLDVVPELPIVTDGLRDELVGLVRRVVKDLDLQLVFRVVQTADRCDDPLNDIVFIVNGELHCHERLPVQERQLCFFAAILQVMVNHHESVRPEGEKYEERKEVEIEHEIREIRILEDLLAEKNCSDCHETVTILRLFRSVCLL